MASKSSIISSAALLLCAGALGVQAATTDDASQSPTTPGTAAPLDAPKQPAVDGTGEGSAAPTTPSGDASFLAEQADDEIISDELIGKVVWGPGEQKIGEVSYLVLDDGGRIVGAVVSVGGFLGIGDTLIGIPWEQLEVSADEQGPSILRARVTVEQLELAPPFKTLAEAQAERQIAKEQLKLLQGE